MNKKLLSLLALILVVLTFTLTGCTSQPNSAANAPAATTASAPVDASASPLGTYEGKVEVEGMDAAVNEAMAQLEGVPGVEGVDTAALTAAVGAAADMSVSLTLSDGGKFTMSMMGQPLEGTYTLEGTKLTLTYAGQPQEATLDGNTITMEQAGMKIVLVKK